MSAVDLALLRFLMASAASMAAGLAVWGLCAALRRTWPALALQRSGWLLAQLTVAAVFVAALAPHAPRMRLVPPVDIEAVDAAVTRYVTPPAAPAVAAPAASREAVSASLSPMAGVARLWAAVYILGLAWCVLRQWRAQRLLRQLAACGAPLPGLPDEGVPVIEVAAPVSPMLLGPWRPRLLVPRHLRAFDPAQRQLILEHEWMHWRRRDLHWMLAGILLQTLLWFNPFMRLLRASLLWAQELGCDRDVLHGRPMGERKAYAAALVAQLQWQCRPVGAALAFGGVSSETVKARIALIRTPGAPRHARQVRWTTAAVLAAVAAGAYALQPALARHGDTVLDGTLHCLTLADAATGQALLRDGQCAVRVTPASTFNIAVSLMGYDRGILHDEHAPRWPFREGYTAWNESWRAPTDPAAWMRNSTVWYAQLVSGQVGATAFQHYLDQFEYGNRDAAGDGDNGLTMSWINSSLRISPDEQVAFLRRIVNRDLGVSPRAYDMTSRLLKVRTLANGWDVYGKTGTGSPVGPDGRDMRDRSYGWFVGWAVKGNRTIVFAHLVQDRQAQDEPAGPRAREALLRALPARLDAL